MSEQDKMADAEDKLFLESIMEKENDLANDEADDIQSFWLFITIIIFFTLFMFLCTYLFVKFQKSIKILFVIMIFFFKKK